MADYNKAIVKVLRHEGVQFLSDGSPDPLHTGYVNRPDDPGGETNWGITRALARRLGYIGEMREMPFSTAMGIYKEVFWDKLTGDQIADDELATEMLDTAVNCGVEVVATFVQRVLNVLNKQESLYPDVVVDGACGPKTVAVLNQACKMSITKLCILRAIDSLQCARYIELAEHNKKFETFLPGWLANRVGSQ